MNRDFLKTCVGLTEMYRTWLLEPTIRSCPGFETEQWSSLKFFLLGYAFERQGRSPDYAPVAADTIDELRGRPIGAEAAEAAWTAFSEKLGGRSLNYANNPMCLQGTCYSRRYRGRPCESRTWSASAVEWAAQELQGEPVFAWARRMLTEDRVSEAHKALARVNGVNDKIASFFLRDVATLGSIRPSKDRHLLQPVDVWIRFVARTLARDNGMDDRKCADFIIENASDPESANQGIWYFCAMVAGSSQYQVSKCLKSPVQMQFMIGQHERALREAAQAASDVAEGGVR